MAVLVILKQPPEFHPGGSLFNKGDPDLELIANWIRSAEDGPGINVSNHQSHPKDVALSDNGRYLFVGNTGTMDISIIDLESMKEVAGLYIQNVANFIALYKDKQQQEHLITLTMGAGFGAAKERDPYGGESWDRNNSAAQYTVLRDPQTTDAYPIDQQHSMGPYDAIDGTWNFKMRDIQNDIVLFDISKLNIPLYQQNQKLNYLVKANKYESHKNWVRYTSDTAEATTGDIKGDIPPELQRVHGAFPEWMAIDGDSLFVSMGGSFELVEWEINTDAKDPSEKLIPIKAWDVGLRPLGVLIGKKGVAKNKLFVINQLSEDISVIDRNNDLINTIDISNKPGEPVLYTDAEKGGLIAHSTVFSSDGDTSCLHCHYRDTGDGRGWGAAETIGQNKAGHFTAGGTLGIPQMKNLYAIQPYYFEGTHILAEGQGADINEPMSSIDFDRPIWAGDFSKINSVVALKDRVLMHEELKERVEIRKLGHEWYDLEERRSAFIRQQSKKYFNKEYELKNLYQYMAAWLGSETRLLPNPFDQHHPSVKRGKKLFNSAQVMCGVVTLHLSLQIKRPL